jgi:hypothetical protein
MVCSGVWAINTTTHPLQTGVFPGPVVLIHESVADNGCSYERGSEVEGGPVEEGEVAQVLQYHRDNMKMERG